MPERRRVAIDVGALTLVGDGHGDPSHRAVILLHGGGQTRHAWGGTAAALADTGWYALAMDLRGHGDSSWCAEGNYSIDALADDLRAVVRHVGGRPVLVGASLGGLTALIAQGEHPEPLGSGLVMVDVAPRLEPSGVARIVDFMTGHPDGFASLDEAADAVAAYAAHRPRPRDPKGLEKNLRLGPDGRYRWHWDPRMMSGDRRPGATRDPTRLEEAARTLTIPTLLVRGRQSDVLSEAGVRAFLELVPHARYVDVSSAGHMVAGDRNDAFTRAVVEFLAELG
jgi:non-heme chloroperoxidase